MAGSCFEDPSRAVTAIAAMGQFGAAFAKAAEPQAAVPLPRGDAAGDHADRGRGQGAARRRRRAGGAGTCLRDSEAAVAAAEQIGYPVVLKILSPDILHKSEIGGVLLDVADADQVRHGFATLLDRAKHHAPAARIEGVLVAKQIKGAVEMALGVFRDPVFGPVAMVGLGGIFIEVLKDVSFRRCPFDTTEAERMIRSLKRLPAAGWRPWPAQGRCAGAGQGAVGAVRLRRRGRAAAGGGGREPAAGAAGRAGLLRRRCGDRTRRGEPLRWRSITRSC